MSFHCYIIRPIGAFMMKCNNELCKNKFAFLNERDGIL